MADLQTSLQEAVRNMVNSIIQQASRASEQQASRASEQEDRPAERPIVRKRSRHIEDSSSDEDFERQRPKVLPRRLPSYLSKKPRQAEKLSKVISYNRDIICLPKFYAKGGSVISIPRGGSIRSVIARNGLMGKIHLESAMSEKQVMSEIRSVFCKPMGGSSTFRFVVLQPTGGTSRKLTVPSLSASFKWTASSVAGKNAKSPIYILAEDELLLDDSAESEDERKMATPKSPIFVDDEPTCSKYVPGTSRYEPTLNNVQGTSHYTTYINLLSDSDSDVASPSPPAHSPITPMNQSMLNISVSDLLSQHKQKVISKDVDLCHRFRIRRKKLFEDAIREFRRGFPMNGSIKVTFIGEPAVDTGGPLREFLHLLLKEIAGNNTLFEGEQGRSPSPNLVEVDKNTFVHVGKIVALSLVHGGPAPSFFTKAAVDYLLHGLSGVVATPKDVTDAVALKAITKLSKVHAEEEFREMLSSDEFDFRYHCGLGQPVTAFKLCDKERIVQLFSKHFAVARCVPQLEQLKEGLRALDVLQLMQDNPVAMSTLFVYNSSELKVDDLYDLFKPTLSPEGCNRREPELTALYQWGNFLQDLAGRGNSTLADVLMFATGATSIPPMGLDPSPTIEFTECRFPTANTCANQLNLPLFLDNDAFEENMFFGLVNGAGFGNV